MKAVTPIATTNTRLAICLVCIVPQFVTLINCKINLFYIL